MEPEVVCLVRSNWRNGSSLSMHMLLDFLPRIINYNHLPPPPRSPEIWAANERVKWGSQKPLSAFIRCGYNLLSLPTFLPGKAIVLHFNDKSSTLTCIWNESALNVYGCQNEMLGAWWEENKEDKVWRLDTVQNEIKPCTACQGCQLIFLSKAHYSITLQFIAYSSVFFNSSHSSPHLLSPMCQQWKKSVNWQMSVTNVNWCLYISGRV